MWLGFWRRRGGSRRFGRDEEWDQQGEGSEKGTRSLPNSGEVTRLFPI